MKQHLEKGTKGWIVCFYSTYEELKPSHILMIQVLWWSFYSTYEELKLAQLVGGRLPEGSFYSTYEELKPAFRNVDSPNPHLFLQYLWGIETQ